MIENHGIVVNTAVFKHEIVLLPTIGILNRRYYYGYPVIGISFIWLKWQVVLVFGLKKFVEVKE